MELYHCANARSIRVVWTLEELGGSLAHAAGGYTLRTLPFPPRVRHREFLKTNVLGTVPHFDDRSSEGGALEMTESCAIPLYLAQRYGAQLAVAPSEPAFGEFLNWCFHADATLTFPQTVVLRYTLQEPGRADAAATDYAKWYVARLRKLDNALKDGREFLVAGRLTVADICITYALWMGGTLYAPGDEEPLSARYQPQTRAYLDRMVARPAFQRALEAQERSEEAFEAALSSKL